MSRRRKNIITGLILIVLIGCSILTMYFAGYSVTNHNVQNMDMNQMNFKGNPPGEGGTSNQETNDSSESSEGESNKKRPERPSGENENSSFEDNNEMRGTPPEKPDGDNGEMGGTPPEMPNEDTDSSMNGETEGNNQNQMNQPNMGGMPNHGMGPGGNGNFQKSENSKISFIYYVLFAVEGVLFGIIFIYWILSGFHKKSFKETFKGKDKLVILALAVTLIGTCFTYLDGILTKTFFSNQTSQVNGGSNAEGSVTVTQKTSLTSNYTSSKSDESVILVTDEGKATIKGATIEKTGGDSSNTENSEFYGINAGVLVQSNSKATIKKSTIKTSAVGSNAVFATGSNSHITISDSTIETTGKSSSRGLDATYGGTIEASNVSITTQGGSSAALATDRGEGTVSVTGSTLETNGSGSPIIYSTGDISITDSEGVANSSQMVVVEGKNSATVTSSKLTASGKGNRDDVDHAGVMIYQSMSGDASEGEGVFTAKDSSLTISKDSDVYKNAPMFFVTNTSAVINLENTKLSYGSGVLLKSEGTDEWGKSGSNGGDVTINAKSETLEGDVVLDKLSSLTLNMEDSTFKGSINSENTAKEIHLKMDSNSKITLTNDSYVTSLENEDETYSNIDFNGYTLYVNGVSVK